MTSSPATNPNIVLTGFMGTGKSTVGRLLANRLGMRFVDTDRLIEETHGPIAEIFLHEGEASFRRYETETAMSLAEQHGLVIATGGRFMLNEANAAPLLASGHVYCLRADEDELIRRLTKSRTVRPLLQVDDPVARIRELLAERAKGYDQFEQVPTDSRPPDRVVNDIIGRYRTATGIE